MRSNDSKTTIAAAFAAVVLLAPAADAQFGIVNLPRNDFTWRWGRNLEEVERRRFEDFSARGGEGGFTCELTGELSPSSRMTPNDIREFENDLQGSLYFIQETASAMNTLDFRRELDWAELACVRPKPSEDPEASAERVERAREKAVREMLERRERREQREQR